MKTVLVLFSSWTLCCWLGAIITSQSTTSWAFSLFRTNYHYRHDYRHYDYYHGRSRSKVQYPNDENSQGQLYYINPNRRRTNNMDRSSDDEDTITTGPPPGGMPLVNDKGIYQIKSEEQFR